MEALPECAWDAQHGVLVLFRAGTQSGPGSARGFALEVRVADGAGAYYAGDFSAAAPLWAIKVPTAGRFELYLYALAGGTDGIDALDASPVAIIPFDADLRPHAQWAAARNHRIRGWLFRVADDAAGLEGLHLEPIELAEGARLEDALAHPPWEEHEAPAALALMRVSGQAADAPRGPTVNPLGRERRTLQVLFTVAEDSKALPTDAVNIEGFDALEVPTLVVDLSPFGDLAERVRAGFCFFHRPYGDEEFRYVSGAKLELIATADHRLLLVWPCDTACHLDHLGVYFSGEASLAPAADPHTGVGVHGDDGGEASCLVGLFYGRDYLLLTEEARHYEHRLAPRCPPFDLTEIDMELHGDWVRVDDHRRCLDWRGAEDAEAFTLLAFADLSGPLDEAPPAAPAHDRHFTSRGMVAALGSFGGFARRPDLAFGCRADMRLAHLLAEAKASWGAKPADTEHFAPAAALATALEPHDAELGAWIEGESPAVQRDLWRFMLAGGRATQWRDLGIPARAVRDDPDALVEGLRIATAASLPDYLEATLEDLGTDIANWSDPPKSFGEVQHRLARLQETEARLDAELDAVNDALARCPWRGRLALAELAGDFSAALRRGERTDAAHLRQGLMAALGRLGAGAAELMAQTVELQTRFALWGLQQYVSELARPSHATPPDQMPAGRQEPGDTEVGEPRQAEIPSAKPKSKGVGPEQARVRARAETPSVRVDHGGGEAEQASHADRGPVDDETPAEARPAQAPGFGVAPDRHEPKQAPTGGVPRREEPAVEDPHRRADQSTDSAAAPPAATAPADKLNAGSGKAEVLDDDDRTTAGADRTAQAEADAAAEPVEPPQAPSTDAPFAGEAAHRGETQTQAPLNMDAAVDPAPLVLDWALRVMAHKGFDFAPTEADTGAHAQDLGHKVDAALLDIEDTWGLDGDDGDDPPAWTGWRAARADGITAALGHACAQARRQLENPRVEARDAAATLHAVIDRIDKARAQIAADAVKVEVQERAQASTGDAAAELLRKLSTRPPAEWDALAAELEKHAAPHAPVTK